MITRILSALVAALLLAGCEGVRFGVAVMQADTEMSVSYGDGKATVSAERDGQRVSGHFSR